MTADGGRPKRLATSAPLGCDDVSDRMGPNNIVMAWENTKPLVVFRSRMRSFDDFVGALFAVGLDSELPQQLSRSEEHTSELQSRQYLVCRLLLEKKKTSAIASGRPISSV